MKPNPYELAALAVTAVNGLEAVGVRGPFTRTADFQYAGVMDARGRRWVVKYPLHSVAGALIEAEAAIAPGMLDALRDGLLPFDVFRPAGFAPVKHGRAVVYTAPIGKPKEFAELDVDGAHELGRAIAAIHSLPHSVVSGAGLPVYDAQTTRRRLLSDLHDADADSRIPATLRRRWENALEAEGMWNFEPRVVHGDVATDQFMWNSGKVASVLGFGNAHVGDPATDFAGLESSMDEELFDAVTESYSNAMGEELDPDFFNRTALLSELALAKWMLFGVRSRNDQVVDDALKMMAELAAQVEDDPELAPGPGWQVESFEPLPEGSASGD